MLTSGGKLLEPLGYRETKCPLSQGLGSTPTTFLLPRLYRLSLHNCLPFQRDLCKHGFVSLKSYLSQSTQDTCHGSFSITLAALSTQTFRGRPFILVLRENRCHQVRPSDSPLLSVCIPFSLYILPFHCPGYPHLCSPMPSPKNLTIHGPSTYSSLPSRTQRQ